MSHSDTPSAAATATAEASEPPGRGWSPRRRPRPLEAGDQRDRTVVQRGVIRSGLISRNRALPCVWSVRMPACAPLNDTARSQLVHRHRGQRAEICSPTESSASSSRICGRDDIGRPCRTARRGLAHRGQHRDHPVAARCAATSVRRPHAAGRGRAPKCRRTSRRVPSRRRSRRAPLSRRVAPVARAGHFLLLETVRAALPMPMSAPRRLLRTAGRHDGAHPRAVARTPG